MHGNTNIKNMKGQHTETDSRILKYSDKNCVSITLKITNYAWTAQELIQVFYGQKLWSSVRNYGVFLFQQRCSTN